MRVLLSILTMLLLLGCSNQLAPVKAPQIDVVAAAQGAIAEFDQDNDGMLSKKEACQGISRSWDRYDANGDGLINQDELEARFRRWSEGDTGLMNVRVNIRRQGKPLIGANVELTPYAFLGENIKPCAGKTDRYGGVFVVIPREHLPENQQDTFGAQVGLYRVRVTHDKVQLGEKYNEQTELSVDVAPVDSNGGFTFDL